MNSKIMFELEEKLKTYATELLMAKIREGTMKPEDITPNLFDFDAKIIYKKDSTKDCTSTMNKQDWRYKKAMATEYLNEMGYAANEYNTSYAHLCNNPDDEYWVNPNIALLSDDWYLVCDDDVNNVLHIFMIPAKDLTAVSKSVYDGLSYWNKTNVLILRTDKPNLDKVNLHIKYNDDTYKDSKSKVGFAKYLIGQYEYNLSNN